jgi:hypothetical protein
MSQQSLEKLGAELRALEERAAIADKVNDAQLGPKFPDLDAAPLEYFDTTEDYARRKVRSLYFDVGEASLRKELIAKRRECDLAYTALVGRQLAQTQNGLAKAQQRMHSLPWLGAGCVAAACVAIGAQFFHLYGAIGGALLGFFVGQGMLASARTERAEAVRLAETDLDEELDTVREDELRPDWFNASEERTGEPDDLFDRESVITNRASRSADRRA